MADRDVRKEVTTEVTSPMDAIAKITIDVEDNIAIAEFFEYVGELFRKKKKVTFFVQSE